MGIKKGFMSGLLCTKSLLKARGIHTVGAEVDWCIGLPTSAWAHGSMVSQDTATVALSKTRKPRLLQGYCPYKKNVLLVAFNEKMTSNAILI